MPSRCKSPLAQCLTLNLEGDPLGSRLSLNTQVPINIYLRLSSEIVGIFDRTIGLHVDCLISWYISIFVAYPHVCA